MDKSGHEGSLVLAEARKSLLFYFQVPFKKDLERPGSYKGDRLWEITGVLPFPFQL
jgi:hypothetical protein